MGGLTCACFSRHLVLLVHGVCRQQLAEPEVSHLQMARLVQEQVPVQIIKDNSDPIQKKEYKSVCAEIGTFHGPPRSADP